MTPQELLDHTFTLRDLLHAEPCPEEFGPLAKHLGLPDLPEHEPWTFVWLDREPALKFYAQHLDQVVTLRDVFAAQPDVLSAKGNARWLYDTNLLPLDMGSSPIDTLHHLWNQSK